MKNKLICLMLCILLICTSCLAAVAETTESTPPPQGEENLTPSPDPSPAPEKAEFKMTVEKKDAFKDEETTIGFKVESNPGISFLKIAVEYDAEHLEMTAFDNANSVFPGITWQAESTQAVASVPANNDVTGLAFSLKFKFKDAAQPANKYAVKIKTDASSVLDTSEQKVDIKTEDGYLAIVCREHTFGPETVTPNTCTQNGSAKKTCTVCLYEDSSEIIAPGHTVPVWTDTLASTCTLQGQKEGVCTVCSQKVTEALALTEHIYGEWETSIPPTLDTLGQLKRLCNVCGLEELQNLAKLVTSVTDPSSGSTVMGNEGLCFPGDSVFSAFQTLFANLGDAEQKQINSLITSLVGKQVYSKYTVYFKNADGTPVTFDGSATITIPVVESLEGVVIVGSDGVSVTVLNAVVGDGLATFTVGQMSDVFYVLHDESDDSVVKTFQNLFNGNDGDTSDDGIAGWIIVIIIAVLLLGLSVLMILLGVQKQRAKERAATVTETETQFSMEEPARSDDTVDMDSADEEDYDSAVQSLVDSWFDGSEQ